MSRSNCSFAAVSPLFACLASLGIPAQTQWVQAAPATIPSERQQTPMVYDSLRDRAVMFSGYSLQLNGGYADTWEWNGNNWFQRFPANSPSARMDHAMAFDRDRGVAVLFGGGSGNGDTWTWDGVDWTQHTAGSAPSPRRSLAMAYDEARHEVVLFAGWDGVTVFDDTWGWNGTQWTQKQPATSPPGVESHAMTYDSHRERVVVFGGWGLGQETWEWDGSNWQQFNTPTSPPWRNRGVMVYDRDRRRCVLFGGGSYSGLHNDVWEYDGNDWQERLPASSPNPRSAPAGAYDSTRHALLVFGGSDWTASLDETWSYGPLNPATLSSFGVACSSATSTPILSSNRGSLPWLAGTFDAEVTGLDPTAAFAFFTLGFSTGQWGSSPLPLPLASYGMPGCTLYIDGLVTAFATASNGVATWPLQFPYAPALTALPLYMQASAPSPGANAAGMLVSNATALVLGSR
jgi:hypothetical protein